MADSFKFAVNVPVRVHITDVTVWPGKPWKDPKTGQTKALPAQTSIQGKFDGVDTKAYLPGPAWKSINAMMKAGIVPDTLDDTTKDPGERTRVTVLEPDVTITLTKPAVAKYEEWAFVLQNVPQPPPSRRIAPPSGAPPQAAVLPVAHRTSPSAKGPQPFDAPVGVAMSGPPDAPLQGDAPFAGPSESGEAIAGAEVSALDAKAEGERVQREALRDAYCALYAEVAEKMLLAHTKTIPAPDREWDEDKALHPFVPVTAESINAATATIWIAYDRLGLQRGIASDALQRWTEAQRQAAEEAAQEGA